MVSRMDRGVMVHVALLLVSSVLAGCVYEAPGEQGGIPVNGETPGSTVDNESKTPDEETVSPGASTVAIRGYRFEPETLRVPVGTQVTWVNLHDADHAVSQVNGAWNSGSLEPGARFNVTFEDSGTFRYVCPFHPEMVGSIVVLGDGDGGGGATGEGTGDTNETTSSGDNGSHDPATNETPSGQEDEEAPPGDGGSGEDAEPASTSEVRIEGFKFVPARLTVPAGTTVVWTNADSAPHTATDERDAFDSGHMPKGDTYSFTFTRAGTYTYRCEYHSSMEATIVVT